MHIWFSVWWWGFSCPSDEAVQQFLLQSGISPPQVRNEQIWTELLCDTTPLGPDVLADAVFSKYCPIPMQAGWPDNAATYNEVAYIKQYIKYTVGRMSESQGYMAPWRWGEQVGWICTDGKTCMHDWGMYLWDYSCEIWKIGPGRAYFCLNIKWTVHKFDCYCQQQQNEPLKMNIFQPDTGSKSRLRWWFGENIHNHKCKQINKTVKRRMQRLVSKTTQQLCRALGQKAVVKNTQFHSACSKKSHSASDYTF